MHDKIKNIIVTIGFAIIILGVFITNIIAKDKEISTTERRKLAQLPEVSMEKIINGDTMEAWDKYATDQFMGRDLFRTIKSFWSMNVFRQKDNNDLLIDEINTNLRFINNKKKILVVNDNYKETLKISNYLRKNNYLVITCLTYLDFEKKINSYKYDFIFLDDEFDGKTALELSDKINKSKIIVMLSKNKSLIKHKYFNNKKFKDIILKENLIAEIKRVID